MLPDRTAVVVVVYYQQRPWPAMSLRPDWHDDVAVTRRQFTGWIPEQTSCTFVVNVVRFELLQYVTQRIRAVVADVRPYTVTTMTNL
jgi:hypothetical protein